MRRPSGPPAIEPTKARTKDVPEPEPGPSRPGIAGDLKDPFARGRE
jgi:hypothetical protein